MELQLNKWRDQLKKKESEQETQLPGLYLSHDHHHSPSALSLFAPDDEPTCTKLSTTTNLSAHSTTFGYEHGKKQGMGVGFSMEQWQELELQALIFRHIISGATIPPQLLHLLITKKSFILSSLSSPYYQNQLAFQHYHPALLCCRSAESITETKGLLRIHNDPSEVDRSDSQTLRHFFDDWPRAIQEPQNTINNASLGTALSILVPGIYPNSDVSLKLSTGIRCEPESGCGEGNGERERFQLHWGTTWGGNQMGGPLAEAFGSSTSTSSPMSVLHQLRAST